MPQINKAGREKEEERGEKKEEQQKEQEEEVNKQTMHFNGESLSSTTIFLFLRFLG